MRLQLASFFGRFWNMEKAKPKTKDQISNLRSKTKKQNAESKTSKKSDKDKMRVVKAVPNKPKKEPKVVKPEKLPEFNIPTPEEMLEAGLHFGHQIRRWHPSMEPYIYSKQNNIHVLDLFKTQEKLKQACEFLYQVAKKGEPIVFIGTKKQAQELIKEKATAAKAMYVTNRWLGGTLTNFSVIKKNIDKLKDLIKKMETGEFNHYTKKERLLIDREIARLENNVGGIVGLNKVPSAVFIVDVKREKTAYREAARLGLPIVALSDTNNDISGVTYPIPGNDDALKSISLVVSVIADAVEKGYKECDRDIKDQNSKLK